MSNKDLIKVANAHIQGNLNYGITMWANENINIINKIEKLRLKAVKVIMGKQAVQGLTEKEQLRLLNWKTLEEHREIYFNTKIHKIMKTKKPGRKYKLLTDERDENQIKYEHIKTVLRSEEKYNEIPYYVRIKNVKNFKLSYKRYRKDLLTKPRFIKNKNNNKYNIIWPGIT